MKNLTKEQLIKKLVEDRVLAIKQLNSIGVGLGDNMDHVKEALEQRWIPCSERLPEAEGKYLTCDGKGNIHVMYHHNSLRYPFGIDENHSQYYPPVAWRHLPKAYKDGE